MQKEEGYLRVNLGRPDEERPESCGCRLHFEPWARSKERESEEVKCWGGGGGRWRKRPKDVDLSKPQEDVDGAACSQKIQNAASAFSRRPDSPCVSFYFKEIKSDRKGYSMEERKNSGCGAYQTPWLAWLSAALTSCTAMVFYTPTLFAGIMIGTPFLFFVFILFSSLVSSM
jgi:hypothetical protein